MVQKLIILLSMWTSIQAVQLNPLSINGHQQPQLQRTDRTLYIEPTQISVPAAGYPSSNCFNQGYLDPSHICLVPPVQKVNFHTSHEERNPLLDALLLSSSIGLHQKVPNFNHFDHLPLNPYLALLLSHYGKYTPIYGSGHGIYGYNAANNYHNNKPFGNYKIYEDV